MISQIKTNKRQGGSPPPSGAGGLLPYYKEGVIEAGCDEAGRGCLAGSVYAAAVILPTDYHNDLLNDSKQLTAKQRYQLREEIERDAVAWSLGIVTAKEIDEMNILRASITAMHRAIDGLKVRPQHLIIDGNRFMPYKKTLSPAVRPQQEHLLRSLPTERHLVSPLNGHYPRKWGGRPCGVLLMSELTEY